MKRAINVLWDGNMRFVSELDGHKMVLDAAEENDGSNMGPRPKGLMMLAIAGCTGMDVVSILKKMQVTLTYFNLLVEGDLSDEHPKKFLEMKLIYEFRGKDLSREKLDKAVNLSVEKYCGVFANYKECMKISYEIRVLD